MIKTMTKWGFAFIGLATAILSFAMLFREGTMDTGVVALAIASWAMWFVCDLEDQLRRREDD